MSACSTIASAIDFVISSTERIASSLPGTTYVSSSGSTFVSPVATTGKTWIPITWRATGPSGLFPVLDGDLEFASLGAELIQLALSGRYQPPLGLVGRTIDKALLSRVAEATIKDFIDRLARAIREVSGEINAQAAE